MRTQPSTTYVYNNAQLHNDNITLIHPNYIITYLIACEWAVGFCGFQTELVIKYSLNVVSSLDFH